MRNAGTSRSRLPHCRYSGKLKTDLAGDYPVKPDNDTRHEDNKKVSVMEKPDSCKRHNHVVFIAGFNNIIITD